jgi:dTDP-glucose 4,6-dehydratase
MKILIAGGAGFIGSHLCRRFLKDGHAVICIDNLLSGSKSNIEELETNSQLTFLQHDICEPLPQAIVSNIDAIFHFACPASPNPKSPVSYMSHPVETMMVSSVGTKNMLDLALQNNCQIILASTSEIYGDPQVHPQTEEYWGNVNTLGPRACYDEGKRFQEALAMVYHRQHGLKSKIIRIFNTYGPHMRLDDGRFTINLINSYINHTPFARHGNMDQITRSFCYIDDLVDGIMRVSETEGMIGNVVNLGNPAELTLNEALTIFEQVTGSKLITEQGEAQTDDPQKRRPDITKAKQLLGWAPKIDFATGIKITLESYQKP